MTYTSPEYGEHWGVRREPRGTEASRTQFFAEEATHPSAETPVQFSDTQKRYDSYRARAYEEQRTEDIKQKLSPSATETSKLDTLQSKEQILAETDKEKSSTKGSPPAPAASSLISEPSSKKSIEDIADDVQKNPNLDNALLTTDSDKTSQWAGKMSKIVEKLGDIFKGGEGVGDLINNINKLTKSGSSPQSVSSVEDTARSLKDGMRSAGGDIESTKKLTDVTREFMQQPEQKDVNSETPTQSTKDVIRAFDAVDDTTTKPIEEKLEGSRINNQLGALMRVDKDFGGFEKGSETEARVSAIKDVSPTYDYGRDKNVNVYSADQQEWRAMVSKDSKETISPEAADTVLQQKELNIEANDKYVEPAVARGVRQDMQENKTEDARTASSSAELHPAMNERLVRADVSPPENRFANTERLVRADVSPPENRFANTERSSRVNALKQEEQPLASAADIRSTQNFPATQPEVFKPKELQPEKREESKAPEDDAAKHQPMEIKIVESEIVIKGLGSGTMSGKAVGQKGHSPM